MIEREENEMVDERDDLGLDPDLLERQAELLGYGGDPRRCETHGTVISSPNGLFDGLCHLCENEADAAFNVEAPQVCDPDCGHLACEDDANERDVDDEPLFLDPPDWKGDF